MLPTIANSFLAEGGVVGKYWGERFMQRHELHSIISRQLDCQRAWNNNPVIIRDWFKFFQRVRDKYSIKHSKFMHNFNKKGVMLGQAASAQVIVDGKTSRERSKNRTVIQPGTRELVSIIETIGANSSYLPPFIIWKGQQHQETQYQITEQDERLRRYTYATSTKGWTDSSLGLHYIEHYDIHTRHLVENTRGDIQSYRMLIMDNHSSHVTWQFIEYALSHKIVLVALPPHSTHKLQPLDVGCFGPLQYHYGVEVDNFCRYGHAGVNKEYFMKLYPVARATAFTRKTICSAQKATGLLPYNPTAILKTLPRTEASASPKTTRSIAIINRQTPKTPKTVEDLESLRNQIAELTTERPDGMLKTPIQRRVEKLFKAAVGFATDAQIQRNKNKQFQRFKIDKKSSRRLLSKGRVLTQEDVDQLKSEDLQKQELAAQKLAQKEYEEGTSLPELNVALYTRAILNPGECNQDWATFTYVFRCNPQPAKEFGSELIWKGGSEECSGKPSDWSTSGAKSRPQRIRKLPSRFLL